MAASQGKENVVRPLQHTPLFSRGLKQEAAQRNKHLTPPIFTALQGFRKLRHKFMQMCIGSNSLFLITDEEHRCKRPNIC